MRCAVVFYLVVTIFGIVYSVPEPLCVIKYWWANVALCGRDAVNNTIDFIPPISQYIALIDLRGQPLKQLPDNGFRNLSSQRSISRIVLQDCQISHVDAGALSNLHNLQLIDLSHNEINQVDNKMFHDTKQIKYIDMTYNKIEVLPNGLFQNLRQLTTLYLADNQIRQVESFSFKNTPSLQFITLNDNQIELMNMLFKDEFVNLAALGLTGNPWKCDCELGPFYEFAIKFNRLNLFELVCEKPSTLQGKMWVDVSRDEFVCRSEDATSTQASVITTSSTEPMTTTEDTISTQDSFMTSAEPMTTTEEDDNIPATVHNRTSYQEVDPGTPQPPMNQNWIPYTISFLVLVCIAPVMIGVVFVVKRTATI